MNHSAYSGSSNSAAATAVTLEAREDEAVAEEDEAPADDDEPAAEEDEAEWAALISLG